MAILPNIDLDSIRPVACYLPSDNYLAALVKIEEFSAKKSGRPCLKWWWQIIDGSFKGQLVASYTGDGSTASYPRMNQLLGEYLDALGLVCILEVKPKELSGLKVTLVVGKSSEDWPEILTVVPAKFYKQKLTRKS